MKPASVDLGGGGVTIYIYIYISLSLRGLGFRVSGLRVSGFGQSLGLGVLTA